MSTEGSAYAFAERIGGRKTIRTPPNIVSLWIMLRQSAGSPRGGGGADPPPPHPHPRRRCSVVQQPSGEGGGGGGCVVESGRWGAPDAQGGGGGGSHGQPWAAGEGVPHAPGPWRGPVHIWSGGPEGPSAHVPGLGGEACAMGPRVSVHPRRIGAFWGACGGCGGEWPAWARGRARGPCPQSRGPCGGRSEGASPSSDDTLPPTLIRSPPAAEACHRPAPPPPPVPAVPQGDVGCVPTGAVGRNQRYTAHNEWAVVRRRSATEQYVGRRQQRTVGGGGGGARGHGVGLFAFGGAYRPLATAPSDPLRGGGGVGTRPRYLIVCLWRRLLASRHCSSRPSVGPNVFWLCQQSPRMTCPV